MTSVRARGLGRRAFLPHSVVSIPFRYGLGIAVSLCLGTGATVVGRGARGRGGGRRRRDVSAPRRAAVSAASAPSTSAPAPPLCLGSIRLRELRPGSRVHTHRRADTHTPAPAHIQLYTRARARRPSHRRALAAGHTEPKRAGRDRSGQPQKWCEVREKGRVGLRWCRRCEMTPMECSAARRPSAADRNGRA